MLLTIPDDAVIVKSNVKPPTLIIQNNVKPPTLIIQNNVKSRRIPYKEVTDYLDSIGYTILISEEDYRGVSKSIPALCARGHNINAKIINLKKGSSCCRKCGAAKSKETCMKKYGVDHVMKTQEVRNKYKETCMERYGVDNVIKNQEIIEKIKQTTTERYGADSILKVPEFREKIKQNMIKKYGVDNSMKVPEFREKFRQNMIKKYGVDNYMKVPEFRDKSKQTNIERYGVDAASKNPIIKEKIRQTHLKRYGVGTPSENPETRAKISKTMLERYGVEHAFHHPEFLEKARQTFISKYGVENPMQKLEIFEKQQKSAFRYKEYTYPSGNIIKCQGYEPFCLNDLLNEGYSEDQIVVGKDSVPEIWYIIAEKKHRYFPDIFIPHENLIIEVKSDYTFEKDLELNLVKEDACRQMGYDFSFRIYKQNGKLLDLT